jgi:tight adherence protein B
MIPFMLLPMGAAATLVMVVLALLGPSTVKARSRRLDSIRDRHASGDGTAAAQAQMRRIQTQQATRLDSYVTRLLPNPDRLRHRLVMTGRTWTLGQYGMACAGLAAVVAVLLFTKGAPIMLVLFGALAVGLGLPHKAISVLIARRVNKFTQHFPDAIELLVRGLRSGLPITETLSVVGSEIPGPVGVEFRLIGDRIRIGRTMDAALQETADRLGTPEFQFFTITLAIQRETGGNLAETLANLADVLRKRAQMKLKIKAMSSESKASAWIIGVLPFLVFAIIHWELPEYIDKFFIDQRLMLTGMGAMLWMGIGVFIMSKMINFEI